MTSHSKILPSCHPTTQGCSFLSPSPQVLLLPSTASNPQTSCTSPAPRPPGFANPLDSESLCICCQRSQQGPHFFPRCVSYCPPTQPAPPNSLHSLLPQLPLDLLTTLPSFRGFTPNEQDFLGLPSPQIPSGSLPPTYSTTQGSLPHPHFSGISFPFPVFNGLPHPSSLPGTSLTCSGYARTPSLHLPIQGPSQTLISLLGTPDPSSPLRNPPPNHHPGFATQGLPPNSNFSTQPLLA